MYSVCNGQQASRQAIRLCVSNAKQLLRAPKLPVPVLGLDPGHRHGCKLAVTAANGAVVAHAVVYPWGSGSHR